MNHLTQSTHPQPAPAARLRSASDKTTAAAGMMAAAAHNIQDRLHAAEVDGVAFSEDELIQLERGWEHLELARQSVYRYVTRPSQFTPDLWSREYQGLPMFGSGAKLGEPKAVPHHSTNPSLQHSN